MEVDQWLKVQEQEDKWAIVPLMTIKEGAARDFTIKKEVQAVTLVVAIRVNAVF